MTNQPNHDIAQQAHDLDDQQLEGVTGGVESPGQAIDNGMKNLDKGMGELDQAFKNW